jgi:hypothetical protein
MGTNQYHEPPEELSPEIRTFARMSTSLIEEVEAIGWYQQRISVEPDAQARAIMEDAQKEEFKHFSMDLEFLLRRTPLWREIAQRTLFSEGDIVSLGTDAEETAGDEEEPDQPGPGGIPETGSLGIGSLREGGSE